MVRWTIIPDNRPEMSPNVIGPELSCCFFPLPPLRLPRFLLPCCGFGFFLSKPMRPIFQPLCATYAFHHVSDVVPFGYSELYGHMIQLLWN